MNAPGKDEMTAEDKNLRKGVRTFCMYCSQLHIDEVEDAFRRFILKDGEQIYSPRIETYKKIHGEVKILYKPMFYGYSFIETDLPKDLYLRVRENIGLTIFTYCRVLRNDEYICPITAEEENIINGLCDENHVVRQSVGYKEGDRLIITDGPLKNRTGLIVKIDRHKRTAILKIPFMGDDRSIKVGLEIVKKI